MCSKETKNRIVRCPSCGSTQLYAVENVKDKIPHLRCFNCGHVFKPITNGTNNKEQDNN